MRKGILSALTAALAGAGMAVAQSPVSPGQTLPEPPALLAPQRVTLAPAPEAEGAKERPADTTKPTPEPIAPPKDAMKAAAQPDKCAPHVEEQLSPLAGRIYGSAEYLLWSTKAERLPALATTGPNTTLGSGGTPTAPGALGSPSTTVLFGEQGALGNYRSGVRATAGYWLDSCQTASVEVSAFILNSERLGFSRSSTDGTLLARPILDPTISSNPLLAESSVVLASGAGAGSVLQTGSISIAMKNEFWGAEANARWYVRGCDWYRAEMLAGFRYLQIKDSLTIADQSTAVPPFMVPVVGQPGVMAASTSNLDSFSTLNDFYGGQIGAHVEMKRDNWCLDVTAKLALGVMHQDLTINGQTVATNAGGASGTTVFPGGVFAQPGFNEGSHSRNEFAIVPELGVVIGYQIGCNAKVFAGYNVLYVRDEALRPGTQIDRVVFVPSANPTIAKPALNLKDNDFWAQGVTAGFEVSF
jgi:hypothetical protein